MDVTCISDLHGYYPELEGGDLLIVGGDLTAKHTPAEFFQFFDWLYEQDYRKKIFIAGNHDQQMQDEDYRGPKGVMKGVFDYLCDSGTEFEGLKIWGSPWTRTFKGMNPKCKAFTFDTEAELALKWDLIPDDVDILVTHSPMYGMGDNVEPLGKRKCVGSKSLLMRMWDNPPKKLHVVGHIHQAYGTYKFADYEYLNASHVNKYYEPVNKPIRIVL